MKNNMKTNSEKIVEILKAEVESYVDYDNLDYMASLTDQGVDSLDFNNVLLVIEEEYDIEIPDSIIGELDTVNALVIYINSRTSA
jgi:acyl carrier protein